MPILTRSEEIRKLSEVQRPGFYIVSHTHISFQGNAGNSLIASLSIASKSFLILCTLDRTQAVAQPLVHKAADRIKRFKVMNVVAYALGFGLTTATSLLLDGPLPRGPASIVTDRGEGQCPNTIPGAPCSSSLQVLVSIHRMSSMHPYVPYPFSP